MPSRSLSVLRIFERVKQEYVHEIEDGPLIQTAVDVQDTHADRAFRM